MPKISAPTVLEHRVRQREALLAAATELLVAEGLAAMTPAAVGAAAGLSRPAVYQYFDSGSGILAAVIEHAFPRANAALAAALDGVSDSRERVDIYVIETLKLAASGAHRPAAALRGATLPAACRNRIAELHREQAAPFVAALEDLAAPNPSLTARLLGGTLEAAMSAVESGVELSAVTARTLSLVRAALAAP